MQSKLCKIDDLKDWKYKNGEILHKSGQFFRVKGVKVKNSFKRSKKLGTNNFYSTSWRYFSFTCP